MVGGLDWPGAVHVPSPIVQSLLKKGLVKIPPRWSGFASDASQAKIMALLAAWELDRGIYHFADRTKGLVSNSLVFAKLSPAMLQGLASHAIYVDLTDFGSSGEALPRGFFAGIDQPAPGRLDLLFAVDHGTHLETQSMALDGKTIDHGLMKMLVDARKIAQRSSDWPETETAQTEALRHTLVSAVLMTCINQNRLKKSSLQSETQSGLSRVARPAWVDWEVGQGIDEQIRAEIQRHGGGFDAADGQSALVGQWCVPLEKDSVRLQFSASSKVNWRAFLGRRQN